MFKKKTLDTTFQTKTTNIVLRLSRSNLSGYFGGLLSRSMSYKEHVSIIFVTGKRNGSNNVSAPISPFDIGLAR